MSSLMDDLRALVLDGVDAQTRTYAVQMLELLGSKPRGTNTGDLATQAMWLAGILAQRGATREDIVRATHRLETECTWFPTNSEISAALDVVMQDVQIVLDFDHADNSVRVFKMREYEYRQLAQSERMALIEQKRAELPPREPMQALALPSENRTPRRLTIESGDTGADDPRKREILEQAKAELGDGKPYRASEASPEVQ